MASLYQKPFTRAAGIALICGLVGLGGCSSMPYDVSVPVLEMPKLPIRLFPERPDPKAPKILPDHERYLEFAIGQYHANQFAVAEFYLKRSLILEHDNPRAMRLLPWAYMFQKKYRKALYAFEKVHTRFPDDARPVTGLGWCYFAMQDYHHALEKFEQALILDKHSLQAKKGIGFAYWMLDHPDSAEPWLRQVYTWHQWERLKSDWQAWNPRPPERLVEVVPSDWQKASLFTPEVEAPRYPSILYTHTESLTHPAVDNAWRLYSKEFYKDALNAFSTLPPEVADQFDAQNGLAWSLLKTGNLVEAEAVFRKLRQTHPGFPGVVNGIGAVKAAYQEKSRFARHYLEIGKYQIAEQHIAELNTAYPEWSLPHSLKGWVQLKRGNETKALQMFQTAISHNPDDEVALDGMRQFETLELAKVFQGDEALAVGDYKRASYLYYEYIRKNDGPLTPMLARAYSGMGFSQYHKGRYELALYNFRKLGGVDALEFERQKGLGLTFYARGEYDKAVDHLIVADALKPDQPDLIHKLDWAVLRSWDAETARDYLLAKAQEKPRRPTPYVGLGWVYYKTGRPNLGVEYFLKSIELDPDIIQTVEFRDMLESERFGWQVYNRLGWEYYHQDEADKALQLFALALERRPRSSEAMKGLGYVYLKLKQYERAGAMLARSIKRNPNTHPVRVTVEGSEPGTKVDLWTSTRTQLARALYHQGRLEDALKWFLAEYERHPNWAEVHDGLGWTYLKMDRLSESRQAFLKSLRLQPINPHSHKGLKQVKLHMAQGRL
ncbi:hypothetical protein NITGR_750001 [Nitrospina gracilis 3/211]|uniref:Tetratricopeptide repeat protein n=2 Tax=Nitrospinaceae TaxID=407032 RepID=M1YMD4_NITG3|nr:hypothetical protein NITGR_750001 [Nitrospina gracilis 3/211]